MAKHNETTTKFKVDISELKAGFQEAQRQIRLANSEFKAATAGMDNWSSSADGLSAKIKQLNSVLDSEKSKLASLEKQYELVSKEQGENSKGAEELKIKINNQKAAIGKTEKQINDYSTKLDALSSDSKEAGKSSDSLAKDIDDVADSADKAESKTGSLGKSLGGALKKGLIGIASAAAGAVTGFLASGEATQEYMEDMGKLEAGFTSSGHSAETAKKSYEGMVGILGETDQSVEAVNHLAKLTKSQEELSQWTDIAAGVYGTFGDSLPIEGLTEAANETAKVGQVTGPLADALNWVGISEDEFNDKLSKCSSEQERSTLITQTLSKAYEGAADAYKETNGDLIASRQATADMTEAMSEMGRIAMPITTALKEGVTELIKAILPGLKEVGEGIKGLMAGTAGAGKQLQDGLNNVFTGLLDKVTSMLPQILQIGLQIITALIQGILQALPKVVESLIGIIPQITQALLSLLPQLVQIGAQLIQSILTGLGEMIPQIVIQIIDIVPKIIDALVSAIPQLINGAVQFFMAIVDAIPQVIQSLLEAIPQIIDSVVLGLQTGIPALINGAVQLLNAIVEAIPKIIPLIIAALPKIINSMVSYLITAIPTLLNGAITLLMALIDAIPKIIPPLIEAIPDIIMAIVNALIENIPVLLKAAVQMFWALIKAIPQVVAGLLKAVPQIITAVMKALSKLPSMLKKFFTGIWTSIKKIFSGVGSWFGGIFGKAWNGIKSAFSAVGTFFANVWTAIKKPFTSVADWFKNIFSKAWTAVKNVFSTGGKVFDGIKDGIANVFKTVVNAIIRGINKVIAVPFNAINGLLNKIRDVSIAGFTPFDGFWGKNPLKVPQIPTLATGGVLKKGKVGFLEGNGDEAVVPLQKNTGWLDEVARRIYDRMDSSGGLAGRTKATNVVNNFYQTNNSPKPLSRLEIYRQSKNLLSMKGV